jgi:hypothetical protein
VTALDDIDGDLPASPEALTTVLLDRYDDEAVCERIEQ